MLFALIQPSSADYWVNHTFDGSTGTCSTPCNEVIKGYTITLPNSYGINLDLVQIEFNSSANPTLKIYTTSGGTLLGTATLTGIIEYKYHQFNFSGVDLTGLSSFYYELTLPYGTKKYHQGGTNNSDNSRITTSITLSGHEPAQFYHTESGVSTNFNVTILEPILKYEWYKNDAVMTNNSNNYTTSFSEGTSYHHNVTVSADGENYTWKILVTREKSGAGDVTSLLNNTWFDILTNSMDGSSPDFTRFFSAMVLPYTTQMGSLFYVFIYLLPLATIWLRQEKVLIPAGLLGIFGLLLIPMLPAEWRLMAGLCVILTSFGVVYSLFKERG